MAGIGMGVMHDAIHGSYSKNKKVNKVLGYTFNLIGANDRIWRIQHNMLHHTFTNIDHADDDINMPIFLRVSPHSKHYQLHRFQYLYIWFFYSLSTISWITAKDFVRLFRYKKMGFITSQKEFKLNLAKMIGWKVLYYSYALILPIIFLPMSWWIIVLAFLIMHLVVGLLVSVIFQIAHIMPATEFPLPNQEGTMTNDWYSHQFFTTTNFSPKNKLLYWAVGGLNYQIEHHVLPDICHVHYKNISPIVAETAKEFGIPYHVKSNLFQALKDHINMLRWLGKTPKIS